jgi:hypothetical protein
MPPTVIKGAQVRDESIDTADIADKAVTLAKMADLVQHVLIGRKSGSTGVPETLTVAEVITLLNLAAGHVIQNDGTPMTQRPTFNISPGSKVLLEDESGDGGVTYLDFSGLEGYAYEMGEAAYLRGWFLA